MKERTLPHNIEAEQALLGSLFMSFTALQKACEEVERDAFYQESHAKIFEVIKYLYENHIPVNASAVITELVSRSWLAQVGGASYLNEIQNSVATGANVEYYINTVLEQYTLRRMIEVATNIVTQSFNNETNISDLMEMAETSILNVAKTRKTGEFRKIQDVLVKTQEDIEALSKQKGTVTGVTTGLYDFDKLTSGFHPKQLIIIAARPAVGKSALALNMLTAAAKSTKKSIAMFSLEMPAEQLAMRMLSSLGQINGKKLQTGKLESEDWRRLNEAISQLSDTNIYFHDAGGITIGEIKAKCRRLSTQGEGLGMVILDYLQLVNGSSKSSQANRQQEVSEISRGLKMMAMELDVPVIALAQLSRDVEKRTDKRPVLSDLRESGSIEQDADIVVAIHPKDMPEDANLDDSIPSPTELIILKHRNGPTGTINILFKKNTSTFLSFKKEDDTNGK